MTKPNPPITAMLAASVATLLLAPSSRAANWTENSPYYETDAWYDISEWFDGNNYNPTDEASWRWDDDVYNRADDVGADADSDAWYGYQNSSSQNSSTNWFYDYYDPAWFYHREGEPMYEYGARYVDYDNDGNYDAMVSYTDTNGDGTFDRYDYRTFSDGSSSSTDTRNGTANTKQPGDAAASAKDTSGAAAGNAGSAGTNASGQAAARTGSNASATQTAMGTPKQQQRLQQQVPIQSREQSLTGEIQQIKQVQVRGGKHTVVQMKQNAELVAVDLGDSTTLQSLNLAKGDQITVHGPRSHVGDKDVILARSLDAKNQTRTIERARRQMTGTVASVHRTKVRGTDHLIAMLDFPGANSGRAPVDFGPADKAAPIVKQGAQVAFSGVPVEVNGKHLLVAQTLRDQNGKMISIIPFRSGMNDNRSTPG